MTTLLENNRAWAEQIRKHDKDFFTKLSNQQNPKYLWIGCSDSRVPANEIVGLMPGEIFVHRNVSNLVYLNDLNCLAVIQYAVEVLKVTDIIVCGHYGCAGVTAAFKKMKLGLIDQWIYGIGDTIERHEEILSHQTEVETLRRLVELNVVEQVRNVCQTNFLQDAWAGNQSVSVHGWVYSVGDGLLRDLDVVVSHAAELHQVYRRALERVHKKTV